MFSVFRGLLLENFIISDFHKQSYNLGIEPSLYYRRDQNRRIEVDCLIDLGISIVPVEIKSGETIVSDFFDSTRNWSEIAETDRSQSYIVYSGDANQKRSSGHVLSWKNAGSLIEKLEKDTE
jgi:hypothetical protein